MSEPRCNPGLRRSKIRSDRSKHLVHILDLADSLQDPVHWHRAVGVESLPSHTVQDRSYRIPDLFALQARLITCSVEEQR